MIRQSSPFPLTGPLRRQAAGAARQIAVASLLSLVVVAGLSAQATTGGEAQDSGATHVEAPAAQSGIVLAAAAP